MRSRRRILIAIVLVLALTAVAIAVRGPRQRRRLAPAPGGADHHRHAARRPARAVRLSRPGHLAESRCLGASTRWSSTMPPRRRRGRLPSLGALLTGRYPAEVGTYTNGDGIHTDYTTLAELFQEQRLRHRVVQHPRAADRRARRLPPGLRYRLSRARDADHQGRAQDAVLRHRAASDAVARGARARAVLRLDPRHGPAPAAHPRQSVSRRARLEALRRRGALDGRGDRTHPRQAAGARPRRRVCWSCSPPITARRSAPSTG